VLIPTLEFLHKKNLLANNWSSYLRAALFCCPFLTVNLLAPHSANGTLAERYNLPIKLLGLAMAVEFGANTHAGSSPLSDLIDNLLA
jgi:hypothetical protein